MNLPEPSSFDALLDDFLLYLRSEKGSSPNTITAYQTDLLQFFSFIHPLTIDSAGKVTSEHATLFLSDLKKRGYSPSTLQRRLIALKVFFQFLKREKIILLNPIEGLEGTKSGQLIPDVLSEGEVNAFFASIDTQTFEGALDLALIELLYATGLRVTELCKLSISDVSDHTVRVFGKGRKERLVPLYQRALYAIDHYVTTYRALFDGKEEPRLFLNRKGRPIDRFYVYKMVVRRAKQAGIQKEVSPHTLRHTFATHLLDHGAELRVIQELLGHSSISSTDRYTHISKQKIKESFHSFHPRL